MYHSFISFFLKYFLTFCRITYSLLILVSVQEASNEHKNDIIQSSS